MSGQEDTQQRLAECRDQIDAIDLQLVKLLNERASVVVEVGRLKHIDPSTPIYAPDREQKVLEKIAGANAGPLPDSCLQAIWKELMSGSFALERPLRIAYLGPAGSFSHLAAKRQFGASVDYAIVESIPAVFHAVETGRADLGLVPIENSTGGGIHDTLDCFLQTTVQAAAEVLIPIHHHVLSHAEADDIKKVYSRPEVFEQCRKWLSEHLRGAERIATTSSAKAAELAAEDHTAAAIGCELASEIYGIPAVYSNIEDNPNNVTRFLVIGHQSSGATGDDKTAILFTTVHEPGALAQVLDIFRDAGMNLTHIDKRPSQRVNWEYYFFVDCEGHAGEQSIIDALGKAKRHCIQLTVLGSFPRARAVLE